MKITTKTTRAELIKIAQDLRVEATGWHQEAKRLEDRLAVVIAESIVQVNARASAETIGDNMLWEMVSLALVIGIIIGWVGNVVL